VTRTPTSSNLCCGCPPHTIRDRLGGERSLCHHGRIAPSACVKFSRFGGFCQSLPHINSPRDCLPLSSVLVFVRGGALLFLSNVSVVFLCVNRIWVPFSLAAPRRPSHGFFFFQPVYLSMPLTHLSTPVRLHAIYGYCTDVSSARNVQASEHSMPPPVTPVSLELYTSLDHALQCFMNTS